MAGSKGASPRPAAKGRSRGPSARRRPTPSAPRTARGPLVEPDTLRSIVGIVLIVLGAITLAALLLGGQGVFGSFVSDILRPAFGQGAWLLGVLLVIAGVMVERGSRLRTGWIGLSVGGLLIFVAGEGLIHLLSGRGDSAAELSAGGGRLGELMSSTLTDLVGSVGAFLVLTGMLVAGILLLFEMTLKALVQPVSTGGRAVAGLAGTPSRPPGRARSGRSHRGTPEGGWRVADERSRRNPGATPGAHRIDPHPAAAGAQSRTPEPDRLGRDGSG